jgi:hypothetical protein
MNLFDVSHGKTIDCTFRKHLHFQPAASLNYLKVLYTCSMSHQFRWD